MPDYEHLRLARSEPVNEKRTRPGRGGPPPADPSAFAQDLLAGLERGTARASSLQAGFDPRLLLKLTYEGNPEDLRSIPGLDVVSQEEKTAIVVFADDDTMRDFKGRLALIASGRRATREDVLFAIKAFDTWMPDDRIGMTLREEPFPEVGTGWLDVELWPLERPQDRATMLSKMTAWCSENQIAVLDMLNRDTLVLLRVQTNQDGYTALLHHRDVRTVDLPPKLKVGFELLTVDLESLAIAGAPHPSAPRIGVLDSGVVSGHPLLAPAIGEAASFLPGKDGADENGHGTMVAGLALYGDVRKCIETRSFVPRFHILSGRVTDQNNENVTKLIENQVAEAVKYFFETYGCRIFNLSVADSRRIYEGGHIGPWASILDDLAREHRVLFVIAAGNFRGTDAGPSDWKQEYPTYLSTSQARLLDPAPAVSALTVGSIARQELARIAETFPRDPAYRPIARSNEPSPFTRAGPGARGSIKPELVHYGGNLAVDARSGTYPSKLGEISTGLNFATGRLFELEAGTSFAAPKVTHLAAEILARYPRASANLIRSLILANARIPKETVTLFGDAEEKMRNVVGYGFPDDARTLASSDAIVGLFAEEEIPENHTHFFELPIPESFYAPGGRRLRRITVALAHSPVVRRSRVEYTASHFEFRIVRAKSLAEVSRIFKRTKKNDRVPISGEVDALEPKKVLRGKGTGQVGTWVIKQTRATRWRDPLFVVVTRSVPPWATGLLETEPYALVAILDDSANEQARLYAEVRAILQVRPQVRPRVRV